MREYIEAHFHKDLDEPIHTATLIKKGVAITSGFGRLLNDKDGEIVMKIYPEAIPIELYNRHHIEGRPLDDEDYYSIEGKTLQGSKLVLERVAGLSLTDRGWGYPELSFHPHIVRILSRYPLPDCNGTVGGILEGLPAADDLFGQDELKGEFENHEFHLRTTKNGGSQVDVSSKESRTAPPIEWADAFRLALSFRSGKRLMWVGYDAVGSGSSVIQLFSRAPIHSSFFPPLGSDFLHPKIEKASSELVECATRFFHQPENSVLHTLLAACWNSMGAAIQSRSLVMCSVLEGIADVVLDRVKPGEEQKAKDNEIKRQYQTLVDAVLSNSALSSKSTSVSVQDVPKGVFPYRGKVSRIEYDESERKLTLTGILVSEEIEKLRLAFGKSDAKGAFERLIETDYVGRMIRTIPADLASGKYKVKRAAELLGMNVSDKEIDAWNRLRHPLSHGDFEFDIDNTAKRHANLERVDCIANLINKFTLRLVGYSGPYKNYSEEGRPYDEFSGLNRNASEKTAPQRTIAENG